MMPIQISSHEEVHAAFQQGEEAVIALFEQIALTLLLLTERVQASEDRLAKNSRNSGKPPSSDGLSKPVPKSLRKRHDKKSGGQPGHAENTLKAVSHPDRVEVHRVQRCRHCRVSLEGVGDYRNRIGGLLLLPKGFNQSLKDDEYETKLQAYFGQNLLKNLA